MNNSLDIWENFLKNMEGYYANKVTFSWFILRNLVPNIRIPETGFTNDRRGFLFIWRDDVNYLEINFATGSQNIQWLYVNNLTHETDGSSEPTTFLSKEVIKHVTNYGVS